MLRFCLWISIVVVASSSFAQSTQSIKREDIDDGAMEKARNEYWYDIRTSGEEKDLGTIERNAYEVMTSMQNTAAFKTLSNPAWQPIAGSQQGHNSGRVRDIAADPNNPNVVYITTGSGGVWKTPDITAKPTPQWINLSDRLPTLMGGAIALDPKNSQNLLLGTGEAEGDGYKFPPGQGLFKSTDAGNNWTQVSAIGGAYSQIMYDSLNPHVVYAAYNNAGFPPESAGILKSTDGGSTWRKLSLNISGPLTIAYNPHTPLVIVVGGYGTVYRSADSGATWTKSMTGITGSVARVSVVNAPTNQNLYYASVGSGSGGSLGFWMSVDAGLNWKQMTSVSNNFATVNPLGKQQEWCNSITVRPLAGLESQVFVAGLDMYFSNDSGKSWKSLSDQNNPVGIYPSTYVHADHHHIAFVGNTLYDCGDGGLAITNNATSNSGWNTSINQGLATLQFVGVDASQGFTFVSGGAQDNSTNRAQIGDQSFTQTRGGDGGRGWISSNDSSIVYTTYVRTTFFKSLDAGRTWNGFGFPSNKYDQGNALEPNTGLFRIDELGYGSGEGSPFYPAYDVSRDGSIVAFGGNTHIWMSTNGGVDNFLAVPASKSTATGTANVIHVWQGEDQTAYMWAGVGNKVYRSTDQGNTWVSTAIPSDSAVEGITSNPNNKNEIFVVTQGIGKTTYKHFFKSEDGGVTFTSPATNFPNIGCWSIAYNPKDGNLYVGTDKGVLYSFDGGVTWNPLMNGMPLAEVLSLKVKGTNNDKLLAGTYGRGIFWLDLSTLGVSGANAPKSISLDPVYPNPVTSQSAELHFSLNDPGLATITLHDVLGREMRILEKSYLEAGVHHVSFSTENLAKGTYFLMLTENGTSVSEKIIVE